MEYEKIAEKELRDLELTFEHEFDEMNGGIHRPYPRENVPIIYSYLKHLDKFQKVLDLGAGTGYLLKILEMLNLKPYGVEAINQVAKVGRKNLEGCCIDEVPEILICNYFDPEFMKQKFLDGTKINEFKAVVCRTYNSGHAVDVLYNVLAKFQQGTVVLLDNEPNLDKFEVSQKLKDLSNEMFSKSGFSNLDRLILKKTSKTNFSDNTLIEFNEALLNEPRYNARNLPNPLDYYDVDVEPLITRFLNKIFKRKTFLSFVRGKYGLYRRIIYNVSRDEFRIR